METFSALLVLCEANSPVTGEFPSQRSVTRSFDLFFDLGLNNRLSKQSKRWWFEIPLCSLWRHCKEMIRNIGGRTNIQNLKTHSVNFVFFLFLKQNIYDWGIKRQLTGMSIFFIWINTCYHTQRHTPALQAPLELYSDETNISLYGRIHLMGYYPLNLIQKYIYLGHQFIAAEWRIYASVNLVIIGSDNGWSPVRRPPVIWSNAYILSTEP